VRIQRHPFQELSDIAFGTHQGDRKQMFISNFARFTGGVGAGVVAMNAGIPGRPLP
jgi:hypothetical protein